MTHPAAKQAEVVLYAQLYELLAQQVLMTQQQQSDPMLLNKQDVRLQFLSYLQDTHFLLVSVQGH